MKKTYALFAGIAFIFGLLGSAVGNFVFGLPDRLPVFQNDRVSVEQKFYVEESSFTQAIEKVRPSVVSIILTKDLQVVRQQPFFFDFNNDPFLSPFEQFFGPLQPQQQPKQKQQPREQKEPEKKRQRVGGGSGFIVAKDGLVVTNRHVVDDDDAQYTVVLSDGQEFPAKLISKDPLNDLAVVKIQTKEGQSKLPDFVSVQFGDSSNLKVGQRVLAIGNALAEYQNTVTAGIISAMGREIVAADARGSSETLSGLLQTDAAINPGNSGGPLVNLAGEVIGVNVAIAASANGIGFAIPANDVKPVVMSVQKTGKIVRPILGVRYMILTEDRAKELQLKGVKNGAMLVSGDESQGEFAVIPGGPGEKAGLKKGDVILEVDSQKIDSDYTLQQAIRNKMPGDKIRVKVWSSGSVNEKTLSLGEAE